MFAKANMKAYTHSPFSMLKRLLIPSPIANEHAMWYIYLVHLNKKKGEIYHESALLKAWRYEYHEPAQTQHHWPRPSTIIPAPFGSDYHWHIARILGNIVFDTMHEDVFAKVTLDVMCRTAYGSSCTRAHAVRLTTYLDDGMSFTKSRHESTTKPISIGQTLYPH